MPSPYNVRRNYRGCNGYSVVGADGKGHGCMKTRRMAIRQQRALYAATQDKKASEVTNIEDQIIKEYKEEMRKELEIWNGSVISKNKKV
jgi:uncharacterized membrane protein